MLTDDSPFSFNQRTVQNVDSEHAHQYIHVHCSSLLHTVAATCKTGIQVGIIAFMENYLEMTLDSA